MNPRTLADHRCRLYVALLTVIMLTGCASTSWVKMRSRPATPLARDLNLFAWSGPEPSERTVQVLRRYDLLDKIHDDPREILERLQKIVEVHPNPENVYAYAELAFIGGKRLEDDRKHGDALDLYGASVAHAYQFLLDDEFQELRNPYDPIFRRACDLYNGALESALRIANKNGELVPGQSHLIETSTQQFDVRVVTRGRHEPTDFTRLEFVSDYKLTGLKNHYRTFGLGVPLIAVHSGKDNNDPAARYYAPGMSFPVTAFLRVLPRTVSAKAGEKTKHFCELELFDPLDGSDIVVNDRLVPLETDLSTPLAFSLTDPTFQKANVATRGFLNAEKSSQVQGLYMLEPYDPDKIPVLMIHGLWSNLITWMEMFNDLRADPEIRNNYQFWFYLYPTGQPFWATAAQLRTELAEMRRRLDPKGENEALNQMVLVGHSMGGLIARMQTIESGDAFWRTISDGSINDIDASDEQRRALAQAMYFHPNPAIKRVVTIASPHRGSNFSNDTTRWLGRKLIQLPKSFVTATEALLRNNHDLIKEEVLRKMQTSVDTLAPDSPILPLILDAPKAPWTTYHNIIGILDENRVISKVAGESDGVVTYESAHLEEAESEVIVDADHVNVHRHPRSVLEVQRILRQHLSEIYAQRQKAPHPEITRLPHQNKTIDQ